MTSATLVLFTPRLEMVSIREPSASVQMTEGASGWQSGDESE